MRLDLGAALGVALAATACGGDRADSTGSALAAASAPPRAPRSAAALDSAVLGPTNPVPTATAAAAPSAAPIAPEHESARAMSTVVSRVPPPPGLQWIASRNGVLLAGEIDDDSAYDCTAYSSLTGAPIDRVRETVSAGGDDQECWQLSPRAALIRVENNRNARWWRIGEGWTACRYSLIAPDDRSCIDDSASVWTDGDEGASYDVRWCNTRPTERATCKTLVTVILPARIDLEPRWQVRYCSPALAVVRTREERLAVDARRGLVVRRERSHASLDAPLERDCRELEARIGPRTKSAKHPRE